MAIHYRRGFFRLWFALSFFWIALAGGWLLVQSKRGDVAAGESVSIERPMSFDEVSRGVETAKARETGRRTQIGNITVAVNIIAPPILVLLLGVGGAWIFKGFKPES